MQLIEKLPEPKELTKYRNSGGTFADFSLEKGKCEVKKQLLKEQHSLCAYCTSSISFHKMKVEHWHPQKGEHGDPEKELDYKNLLAVCLGCYNSGEHFHCDTSKGDTPIKLNPQKKIHIEQLSYTKSTGILKSSNLDHQKEIDSDKMLNLNISPLQKIRKDLLANFRIALNQKYKDKTANYAKELNKFSVKRNPFSGIIIWYLKSKLNKN